MFGAAVDLAIGLVLVYFLFSLVTSGINEFIAKWSRLRAKHLEAGIKKLLGDQDLVEAFFDHPSIKALSGNKGRINLIGTTLRTPDERSRKPSYIPSDAFASSLLSIIGNRSATRKPTGVGGELQLSDLTEANLEVWLNQLPDDLKRNLQLLFTDAGNDFDKFTKEIETWFDHAMDRVSGWYKRNTKSLMFVIGLVIAFAGNVDTVLLARTLWADAPLRASVVAQAQNAVANFSPGPVATPSPGTSGSGGSSTPADETAASTRATCPLPLDTSSGSDDNGTAANSPPGDSLDCIAQQIEQIQALHIPIGWTTDVDDPRHPNGSAEIALKFGGLLATAFALSFGAAFWFELLGKLTSLRSSGPTPPKQEESKEPNT